MDIDEMERMLRMQDALLDITANIKAIQEALYKAGITDPVSLEKSFAEWRNAFSQSPEGRRLEEAQNLLKQMKGRH